MKGVLIVQYHFLPVHNVGVQQFASYCRHLPASGWRPFVLSGDWSAGVRAEDRRWGLSYEPGELSSAGEMTSVHPVAQQPSRARLRDLHAWLRHDPHRVRRALLSPARRALSAFWPLFGDYPDEFKDWIEPATEAGVELVRRHGIQVVVSNCPPESNHLVASRVAARCGIPWVPYFGDLYHFYIGEADWHGSRWRRALARAMHRRWLRPASRALAVSPRMAQMLTELYGVAGEVVVVGYDEERFPPREATRGEKFLLSHTGSIYPGDQRPELLFDALDLLLERCPEAAERLEVRLVGSKCEGQLRGMVAGRPCEAVCVITAKVPPVEAIRLQRGSDVLVLFNLTTPRARSGTLSYPSKIFEYLAAGRPVLALPADGDWVDHLLAQTEGGVAASTPAAVAEALERWFASWAAGTALPPTGKDAAIREYSQHRQAERLADVLHRVVDGD
jgi:glycosyltransferase involved in cell wall biosynthesis